jgi:arylsulfatase A-like enzyme
MAYLRIRVVSVPLLLCCSLALAGTTHAQTKKPNILVIFGDDIGQTNISAYGLGVVGYRTPNIDRIAKEGMLFTDYYAENVTAAS